MSESGFASLGPSLLARKGGAKPAMRPQVAPLMADAAAIAAFADEQLEDLGWNDMGDLANGSLGQSGLEGGADIVPINADISAQQIATGERAANAGPIVHRQQRRLEERVLADATMTGPDEREPEYGKDEGYPVGSLSGEADNGADQDYADEDSDSVIYAPLAAAPAPAPAPTLGASSPARTKARVPALQSGRRAAFTLRLDADRHLKLRLAATMQGTSAQVLVTEALDRLLAGYDDLDMIAKHLKRH
jgi:hypothetical protein